MQYRDLRDFIAQLERRGELKRIAVEIDPRFEMTEICDRVLKAQGPALLFEKPKALRMPVLGNLFGTPLRVALGMGAEKVEALREIGQLLATLKEPEVPRGIRDAWDKLPLLKRVLTMEPKLVGSAPCQEQVWEGDDVDLGRLPIQTCWPGDAGPLVPWGLTVTRGPQKKRQNLGIYRQQVIAPNKVIVRWLSARGGALDYRDHCLAHPRAPVAPAGARGGDPADPPPPRPTPTYHSTPAGTPPDEPAVLGAALNEVFVPLLVKQFPEIVDFYLPPEGCSYRLPGGRITKNKPGHP